MTKLATDVRVIGAELYFLPVKTRVPLKFGPETLTSVTCARARVRVMDRAGKTAEGWGETPLSVQWVWPSKLAYEPRHEAMKQFCVKLAGAFSEFDSYGHAVEVGFDFQHQVLPKLTREFNAQLKVGEPMPYLSALVCCSLFDMALHDAYGQLLGKPVYETYGAPFMSRDLSAFLTPAEGTSVNFAGKHVRDYLVSSPPKQMAAWHLVGGLDAVDESDLKGDEPKDGYPVLLRDWIRTDGLKCLKVLLRDWIRTDGLKCLKVKLRGTDAAWDYQRLVRVGKVAMEEGVDWLTTDFNATVADPAYVNEIVDRLRDEHPRLHGMILYVEQPFPYDLETHRIDVHSVSARKPLFMDESAHDWHLVKLGRSLGWTGVALKTCKTQTGALLSLCWAKAHGMTLMVQDLTNPMLAQVPHVLLAAYAGTIMGVETNAMQFYPEASSIEAKVHPGLYRRRGGKVDLSTIGGPGFGYRAKEIGRELPAAVVVAGR